LNDNYEQIHKELGNEFEWFEGKVAAGLGVYKEVEDVFDEISIEESFDWMYKRVILFKEVLVPYINRYREERK
jgi:hypothetical protein